MFHSPSRKTYNCHMPCVFRAHGKTFLVDRFLLKSRLRPYQVLRKGLPHPVRSRDTNLGYSGFKIDASRADFSDLGKQIKDAIRFLKRNRKELAILSKFRGVETIELDFGIASRDVPVQCDSFPAELVRLAGELNIGITLSQYPSAKGKPKK